MTSPKRLASCDHDECGIIECSHAKAPRKSGSDQRLVRLGVDDLKAIAGARCCDIYDDFTEDEAKRQPPSIYEAWKVGRDIRAIHQPNDQAVATPTGAAAQHAENDGSQS